MEETKQQAAEAASSAKETVQEVAAETKEKVAAAAEVVAEKAVEAKDATVDAAKSATETVQGRIIFSNIISINTLSNRENK